MKTLTFKLSQMLLEILRNPSPATSNNMHELCQFNKDGNYITYTLELYYK